MSTKFNMTRDINGYNSFGLVPAYDKQNTILAATVSQDFTVPSNFIDCVAVFYFEPGSSIWVSYNSTPTLPNGGVSDTNCEGNPTVWQVKGGDVISMITNNTTAEVGIKYYGL